MWGVGGYGVCAGGPPHPAAAPARVSGAEGGRVNRLGQEVEKTAARPEGASGGNKAAGPGPNGTTAEQTAKSPAVPAAVKWTDGGQGCPRKEKGSTHRQAAQHCPRPSRLTRGHRGHRHTPKGKV